MEQGNKSNIGRSWCYTINNYTEEEKERLRSVPAKRHVCGDEVGESGNPHLQGYIRFEKNQRFSWWKNQFPRAHVEVRQGSEKQAADYCKKSGNVLWDIGYDNDGQEKYGSRAAETQAVIEEIEDGMKYGQIRARHKSFFFFYRSNVVSYMSDQKRLKEDLDYDPSVYMVDSQRKHEAYVSNGF